MLINIILRKIIYIYIYIYNYNKTKQFFYIYTSEHTGAVAPVYPHFFNFYKINNIYFQNIYNKF